MVDLRHGDCLDVLRSLPDASVDAVVTDPPYGLAFMGKRWDYDVPSVEIWAECLRVLKPGGHLLAFAGTRTQHRMAVRIEDAGFEIRDMIAWVYSTGFPKSLDVSKAIDKRGGATAGFEEFRDAVKAAMARNGVSRATLTDALGNHMLSHYLTAGSQPAIPNARDYRIIRDTVGLGNAWDHLFPNEAEREVVGQRRTGDPVAWFAQSQRNDGVVDITAPATDAARQWAGWGTALKPALEPITVARKPFKGTIAANVLKHGTGALNVDGCRIENGEAVLGRWPANLIHDGSDEVVGLFPQSTSGANPTRRGGMGYHGAEGQESCDAPRGAESGSAARFFYCAKASKRDRDEGLDGFAIRSAGEVTGGREDGSAGLQSPRAGAGRTNGARNHHPTVKPTDLMRYLCRLVTPPGGLVLDPFMGSGSTGKAAVLEGFRFVGIEREAEYVEIARARIEAVTPATEEPTKAPALDDAQLSLWDAP